MTKQKKRIFFFAFLFVAVIILFLGFYYSKKNQNSLWDTPKSAVFFIPHPDDETLNMGVAVAKSVQAGRPTYLVLLTHGRETGALNIINKSLRNQGKYNALPLLTRDGLEKVRINEFYRASEALGVPSSNLYIEYLDKNTRSIHYNPTRIAMEKYVEKFPNSDFYALSWIDVHYDHRVSGQVLRDPYEEGFISRDNHVHFLISMATKMFLEKHKTKVPGEKMQATSYPIQNKVRNAMKAYRVWDPKEGLYAVGYNSVYMQFKRLNREVNHYVHGVNF